MNDKERDLTTRRNNLVTEETNLANEDILLAAEQLRISGLAMPLNAVDQASLNALIPRRAAIATRLIAIRAEIPRINHMIAQINPHRKAEYQELSNLTNRFDFARPIADIKQDIYNVGIDIMIP
ncbi:MAG: hypothetical protein WCJ39_08630 [bacterium]